ncbi:hypothetical protein L596_025045 [Steinernema carpocapsae]|uniref:Uncharacterized protein n=1 Tax=Steinernema carpocapsae TaxID=34508 RepID=A0A4U5M6T2_STECR|nr:hypothetical protein L596_025045 [Steinernema carpocapsae]
MREVMNELANNSEQEIRNQLNRGVTHVLATARHLPKTLQQIKGVIDKERVALAKVRDEAMKFLHEDRDPIKHPAPMGSEPASVSEGLEPKKPKLASSLECLLCRKGHEPAVCNAPIPWRKRYKMMVTKAMRYKHCLVKY